VQAGPRTWNTLMLCPCTDAVMSSDPEPSQASSANGAACARKCATTARLATSRTITVPAAPSAGSPSSRGESLRAIPAFAATRCPRGGAALARRSPGPSPAQRRRLAAALAGAHGCPSPPAASVRVASPQSRFRAGRRSIRARALRRAPGRAPRQAAGGRPAPGADARGHRLVARLAQHAQLAAAAARGGRRGRAHGLGRGRVGADVGRQGRAPGAAAAAAAPAAARRCQRLRQHAARHALHGLRGHDQADASENLPCPHPVRDALPGAGADPVAQPLSAMLTATDRPLLLDLWILL